MISIATALFQPSSLLLLDEPLSGIDSASSDKITDLLKRIAKENFVTILMTLHQVRFGIVQARISTFPIKYYY